MAEQRLGRYELIAEIGRGASGVVYKARDPIIDRVVAIKMIDFRRLGEAQARAQGHFFQEAQSAGRLSHPNIVTIFDAGEADGSAYIAMELLDGVSLREMLDAQPLLSHTRALEIAAQIARGLAYAHEHGVVHRDVKPANVIVVGERRVKITDFGIARIATGEVSAQSELAGSPKYMSPEQVRGDALDGRSDLFSLGATLYEMLTGEAPFTGDSVSAIMNAVLYEAPMAPSALNRLLPGELDDLLRRMLAKMPEERHPSARALLRELVVLIKRFGGDTTSARDSADRSEARARARARRAARKLKGIEGDATVVISASARPSGKKRKPRTVFYRAGAAGALVLIALVISVYRSGPPESIPPGHTAITSAQAEPTQLNVESARAGDHGATGTAAAASQLETKTSDAPISQSPAPTTLSATKAESHAATHKSATARSKKKTPAVETLAAAAPPSAAARETATLNIAVAPWGEVIIDGQSRGTAPPLSSVSVTPGKHRIEIRNANSPPHIVELSLNAGDSRRIKYKFE
jgi:serine/threonine-protein kinase